MEENILRPCATWEENLATLHPKDLSVAERGALNEHMAGCPDCTAAFADYQKMDSLIREAFVNDSPLELPEWLTQYDLATKLPPLPVSHRYQKLQETPSVKNAEPTEEQAKQQNLL